MINGKKAGMIMTKHTGYFGKFGGRFVPETLMQPLENLEKAYYEAMKDGDFLRDLANLYTHYSGRPTPVYYAKRLSDSIGGAKIYLKREDLNHTGAHKLNNVLGQVLLAQRMGKKNIIAETGAGQHGVATATVCALFGLKCTVYMGQVDIERQASNVSRMKLLGAKVKPILEGEGTLKDATSAAIRDWVADADDIFYVIGSVVGPHPYPLMVRSFQKIIGEEARRQILEMTGRLPDILVAAIGGGSNAIGLFHPFEKDQTVKMLGVEAGGLSNEVGEHAKTIGLGRDGIIHGMRTVLLHDDKGHIAPVHSISAGLDYPGVGPEHAFYHESGRAKYIGIKDKEALEAFHILSRMEGIIPALESAHALAGAMETARNMGKDKIILVNLSGRGDKDMDTVLKMESERNHEE